MFKDDYILHRTDPSRNMARFYAVTIESSLFGDHAVVRRWGRIGTPGRQIINLFSSLQAARCAALALAKQKRQRGYERV